MSSVSYDLFTSVDADGVRKVPFLCMCVPVQVTVFCRTVGTSTAADYASLQIWWLFSRAGKKTSEATATGCIYYFIDSNLSFSCCSVPSHIQRTGDIVMFLTQGFVVVVFTFGKKIFKWGLILCLLCFHTYTASKLVWLCYCPFCRKGLVLLVNVVSWPE